MRKHTEHVIVVVAVLAAIAVGLGVFAYSGLYNIGADDHHWPMTYRVLQTLRDRSIHVRSEHIKVPNLRSSAGSGTIRPTRRTCGSASPCASHAGT